MADEKAEKVIHSAVRVDENKDRGDGRVTHASKLYGPGDEKALAKEVSKEQLQKLSEEGSISGFGFDPKPEEGAVPAPAEGAPAE